MPSSSSVTLLRRHGELEIRVRGPLDAQTGQAIYDALAQLEPRTGLRVLVDLCEADDIDDAGQGALHAINTLSIDEGFGLRIAAADAASAATLDALGLPLAPCPPRGGAQP